MEDFPTNVMELIQIKTAMYPPRIIEIRGNDGCLALAKGEGRLGVSSPALEGAKHGYAPDLCGQPRLHLFRMASITKRA